MKIRRLCMVLSAVFISACSALCVGSIFTGCGKNGDTKESIVESDRSGYETLEFQPIVKPEGMDAFAVLSDGTLLGGGSGGKLYVYDRNGTGREEIGLDGSYLTYFCSDGDTVYAYDYNKRAVVELTGGAGADLSSAFSGNVRVVEDGITYHSIRNMVALNGKLYVLAIPSTEENGETFFSFGMQEFEDYGEQVYCIDVRSGEYNILDLKHICAESCSEDGRLFFYGWQEDKYYLYEYDTEKDKVSEKLSFGSMGNLLNIVVEGGYLFGFHSSEGLVGIDLTNGEKIVWSQDIYAMFGNDLQFYRGNLFVNNMAAQEIRQVLAIDTEGNITEIAGKSGSVVADGSVGGLEDNGNFGNGEKSENDTDSEKNAPEPTEWPKRTETIAVGTTGALQISSKEIKKISGMKTREITLPLDLEAIITELMAGNPEVDIYVLPYAWPLTQRIRELELYVPLNDSEIISEHIGKCFDYIQAAATNDNGDIWMLPLYEYCESTWYIPENMQKFDITPEDLSTIDAYLAVLERLHGKTGGYQYYNQGSVFWDVCDMLYDVNYNDYTTGEINFNTERYRKLADFFWTGWDRYSGVAANHPWFFNVAQRQSGEQRVGKTPDFDISSVIFKTVDTSEHLNKYLFSDPEHSTALLEGWRVLQFPKIEPDAEKGLVSVEYMYVNPFGRQQEAAKEYLEVIAANQNQISDLPIFFREDMEYYGELYDTSLPAFQDIYGIYKNSAVWYRYSWDLSSEFITEYQRGLISFDEAIERKQKQAVTGLYE